MRKNQVQKEEVTNKKVKTTFPFKQIQTKKLSV